MKYFLIIFLFFAIFDLPYWYYQIIRIFSTIGFAYLSYYDYKKQFNITPWVYGIGAIIFNPIIPIYFGRDLWKIIDLIFIIVLLITLIQDKKLSSNKTRLKD